MSCRIITEEKSMKLTRSTGGILVLCLCLCLTVSLTAAADQIAKGDKALRAGDTAKAIAAYQKALGANPESARTTYNLGLAYKASGNLDKASKSFTVALGIRRLSIIDVAGENCRNSNPSLLDPDDIPHISWLYAPCAVRQGNKLVCQRFFYRNACFLFGLVNTIF